MGTLGLFTPALLSRVWLGRDAFRLDWLQFKQEQRLKFLEGSCEVSAPRNQICQENNECQDRKAKSVEAAVNN